MENKQVCIKIKSVKNGYMIEGYSEEDPGESQTYVYEKLEQALKEVPGLMSVLQEGMPKTRKEMAMKGDY